MSNNHVGEIVFSIGEASRTDKPSVEVKVEDFQYSLDNVNWQTLSEEKKEETVEAKLGIGKNGEEVTGEVGVGKSAFYDGRSYYHTYFVPFNSDVNKSLFVKYDCNGKHFEHEFKPEGNMNNLKYDLVHYKDKADVKIFELRGIAIFAKDEDLGKVRRNSGDNHMTLIGSDGNGSFALSVSTSRYNYVKKDGIYRGLMKWYILEQLPGNGLTFYPCGGGFSSSVAVNFDDLKEKDVAMLYTNDGTPKIEEIEWKGLEKTISDLEARDGIKQEKVENEINIQPQQEPENPNIIPEVPEKQNTKKGFFARLWDSIKNFFRAIFRFFGIKVGEETENPVSVPEQNPQPKTQSKEPDSLVEHINEMQQAQNTKTDNKKSVGPVPLLADGNSEEKTDNQNNTIDNTETTI